MAARFCHASTGAVVLGLGLVACAAPAPSPASAPTPEARPAADPTPPAEVVDPSPTPAIAEPDPAPAVAEPADVPEPPSAAATEPADRAVAARARDPRTAARTPRERTLLVAELQALERLFGATRKASPDRAVLMHRLAEGYVELGYSAARDSGGAKVVLAARKNALKYYLAVRDEYPTYAKLDEILYFAGYEHERAGDLPRARALYRELISKFSGSAFRLRIPGSVLGR